MQQNCVFEDGAINAAGAELDRMQSHLHHSPSKRKKKKVNKEKNNRACFNRCYSMNSHGKASMHSQPSKLIFSKGLLKTAAVHTMTVTGLKNKFHITRLMKKLVSTSWLVVILVLSLAWLLFNVIFGLVLFAVSHVETYSIHSYRNASSTTFEESFFLAAQTISTVGYGVLRPNEGSFAINFVVTIFGFLGLIFTSLLATIIFEKLASPNIFICFSNKILIDTVGDNRKVSFRVMNVWRSKPILTVQANVDVTIKCRNSSNKIVLKNFSLILDNDGFSPSMIERYTPPTHFYFVL